MIAAAVICKDSNNYDQIFGSIRAKYVKELGVGNNRDQPLLSVLFPERHAFKLAECSADNGIRCRLSIRLN